MGAANKKPYIIIKIGLDYLYMGSRITGYTYIFEMMRHAELNYQSYNFS